MYKYSAIKTLNNFQRLSKKYWNAVLNPESIILFLNHSEDIDLEVDDDNDDYEELSSIFFEDVNNPD